MSRILKLNRDDGKKTGGFVKVRISADVIAHFFQQSKRAFSVTKGLPEGAELVDFVFDPAKRQGVAVFTHPFLPLTPQDDVGGVPYQEVEYTAYELTGVVPNG